MTSIDDKNEPAAAAAAGVRVLSRLAQRIDDLRARLGRDRRAGEDGDRTPDPSVIGSRAARASLLCSLAGVLVLGTAAPAGARGGRYVFDGGTVRQQQEVRQALDASLFDWSVIPACITVRIARGIASAAVPGQISLDGDLLDAGRFSWGVVQHEYAHEVDFLLLDDKLRARLSSVLGGRSWWQAGATLPHADLTSERFASTLAWAYWPSPDNVMRPTSPRDEAAAVSPAAFRSLLAELLEIAAPTTAPVASASGPASPRP